MSGNSFRGHMHLWYFKHVLYPSNFWFSKFIAGKLGRQVIFILPFVFSLTIQLDNFNYRVFLCFFLKFFLIMMCSYNFTVNMHSGYHLQCFYTLYLCTRKTIKQRLKTHRFVERVTQRILHEFKNSSIGIVYSNWNVKNRQHAGPVHQTLVPPTTPTPTQTQTHTNTQHLAK